MNDTDEKALASLAKRILAMPPKLREDSKIGRRPAKSKPDSVSPPVSSHVGGARRKKPSPSA